MSEKTNPKHNVAQNIWWMAKIAWQTRKQVLLFWERSCSLPSFCS